MSVIQHLDHLVYAAPDLASACADIERRLGVAPSPGGQHLGRGTRNAILAIGPTSYLEIIAPDPDQRPPPTARWFHVDTIEGPRLVAWAAASTNLSSLVHDAAQRGVHLGAVQSGSRKRADGITLSWDVTDPTTVLADGIVPFFIDWKSSPHPAASANVGPTLIELRGQHPNPEIARAMLDALGVDLQLDSATHPALIATFRGPSGLVHLS